MEPHTVEIRSDKVIGTGYWTELWKYRELLGFLAWRDLTVKYKQTALGVLWILLQPLLTMAIFSFIFGKIGTFATGDIPYPLFALAGLVPWSYFSMIISYSSNSLITDSNLIKKVYCPRIIIPLASVTAGIVDVGIVLGAFLCIRLLYGYGWHWEMLFGLLSLVWLVLATAGISFWLSALNVRYRDVRHTIPFLIQIGLFVSPIVYPLSLIQSSYQFLYACNPLVGVIETFRWAMFTPEYSIEQSLVPIAISFVSTALIFIGGVRFFHKMERGFVDSL